MKPTHAHGDRIDLTHEGVRPLSYVYAPEEAYEAPKG